MEPNFIRRTGTGSTVVKVLLWASALAAIFFTGPLMLVTLRDLYSLNWAQLGDIGQTFAGVSTLLTAAALVGVAISVRAQAREVQSSHAIAIFNAQRELIERALDDPTCLSCISPDSTEDARRAVYNTLWLRYYELAYTTHNFSAERIVLDIKNERFALDPAREHWERVREIWMENGHPDFIALVEAAYRASEPPEPQDEA